MRKVRPSSRRANFFGMDASVWSDGTNRWRKGDLEADDFAGAPLSHSRLYLFYFVIFLVVLVFVGKLFALTVVDGSKNLALADTNRVKLIQTEAPRGRILDRNGKVLAESRTTYILTKGESSREISESDAKNLEQTGGAGEYFEGASGKITEVVKREYPLGAAAAHVLGYVSVTQAEEKQQDPTISTINSQGRLGVEANYNSFLTGEVGKRLIEVDSGGQNVSVLGKEAPKAGRDIHMTLDGDLQKAVYESLAKYTKISGGNKGAVVVENPQTGEVLALVSSPSFDPQDIGKAVADNDLPFFNRAVAGTYPPGSVFKIVTSLAGLESGKITKDTEVDDVGKIEVGGQTFSNWLYTEYGRTDGLIKLEKAIARSNDIFFYKAGQEMGVGNIKNMAAKLGYGQKTGIDLPEEAFGLVPDEVWKKSTIGESWYLGDTIHMAIGQGFLLTTPVQVNGVTSFVAAGRLTKPFLVNKIDSGRGSGEIKFDSRTVGEGLVGGANLDLVRRGMVGACQTGGTGFPFFTTSYKVACKTGTAEEAGGESHAWFTVYAPVDKPQIAMSVVVEQGGQGSAVAAPVAKDILDWWFENRR